MKSKQKEELRTKNIEELVKESIKLEQEIWQLRIDIGLGKVKDIRSVAKKRDQLAVIKTIITEKKYQDKSKV